MLEFGLVLEPVLEPELELEQHEPEPGDSIEGKMAQSENGRGDGALLLPCGRPFARECVRGGGGWRKRRSGGHSLLLDIGRLLSETQTFSSRLAPVCTLMCVLSEEGRLKRLSQTGLD